MIIAEAMKLQLAKPNRAVVNGEASFVRSRLEVAGHEKLAREYWSWVVSHPEWRKANPVFGLEVLELQEKLDEIDNSCTMPAWGTYGT